MKTIQKSAKLNNVCYDIRGPVLEKAKQMEEDGHKIIKLNIGNLAPFGFDAPEEIQLDMIRNLPNSAGYSDSKGIFAARKAVMHYTQEQGIKNVTLDDIYLGNGASELISLATNALLDQGDELLLPAPDYPLWTAVTSLSGGTPVHYYCDESNGWMPDLDDIRAKITPNTKGIVVINPNNPTGALYSDDLLRGIIAIAREHGLVIFADEVYDKVLFDDNKHTALGSLSEDVLTITFNSLSKSYRSCGYRAGWMVVSGDKKAASDYIEGLNMLSSMRLCANVPGQWAIQTALGGYQTINDLVSEGGRLRRQRELPRRLPLRDHLRGRPHPRGARRRLGLVRPPRARGARGELHLRLRREARGRRETGGARAVFRRRSERRGANGLPSGDEGQTGLECGDLCGGEVLH